MKPSTIDSQNARIERLERLVKDLEERLKKSDSKCRALELENKRLQTELEKVKRLHASQSAAPFSLNKKKSNPQVAGRKKGIGLFTHKKAPSEHQINRRVTVDNPLKRCFECNGELEFIGFSKAWTTDIPEIIIPTVTEFSIENKRCVSCKKLSRGSHAEISADQIGVSAHRLGSRVKALAQWLHHEIGVSQRAIPMILKACFGIAMTQSAITKDALKRGNTDFLEMYKNMREEIKVSSYAHTDDTGWRIKGLPAYMMGFKTPDVVLYQIRDKHTNAEVREVIGNDFKGILITDRFKSYDHSSLIDVNMQKCLGHILRNLSDVLEKRVGRARQFPLQLKALFKATIKLHSRFKNKEISLGEYNRLGRGFQRKLSVLLAPRVLTKANSSLRVGLAKHHARGSLLRFLTDPSIDPTNNAAERMLRPCVRRRKVSGCSKSVNGATAFCVYKSLLETAKLQGVPSLEFMTQTYLE
jgi:transposase